MRFRTCCTVLYIELAGPGSLGTDLDITPRTIPIAVVNEK